MLAEGALKNLVDLIKKEDPDCISLTGLMTTDGTRPETFVHSIKYTSFQKINGIHTRPPNHVNVIRSSIAKQFMFPLKNHGEDSDWSLSICRARILGKEAAYPSDEPYYFYNYSTVKENPSNRGIKK